MEKLGLESMNITQLEDLIIKQKDQIDLTETAKVFKEKLRKHYVEVALRQAPQSQPETKIKKRKRFWK